jgi:hypothetical protein
MITTIPRPTGQRPKTYERGRTCTTCDTTLSIYNSRTRCAACQPVPQLATEREQLDAMADLVALMEEES